MSLLLLKGKPSTVDLVLTSLYKLLWYCKHYLLFYKTSYLNEEVNSTKPSPSVREPLLKGKPRTVDLLVLTSLEELLCYCKHYLLFYKTSYLIEEVNSTKPSPSLSLPCISYYVLVSMTNKRSFITPEPEVAASTGWDTFRRTGETSPSSRSARPPIGRWKRSVSFMKIILSVALKRYNLHSHVLLYFNALTELLDKSSAMLSVTITSVMLNKITKRCQVTRHSF